jgi:cation:H+ antiporter
MGMLCEIIPGSFFEGLRDWELVLWVLMAVSIGLLVVGADRAVSSAAKLAASLGMGKVLIGATVVSLGTTSPEAAVSVNAAIRGDGGLALGNGVGSIICDTALIFGLCCCLTRIPKDRFVLRRHGWLKMGAGLLLVAVSFLAWGFAGSADAVYLGRPVGLLFLGLLVGYMVLSVRWARQHPEMALGELEGLMEDGAEGEEGSASGRRPAEGTSGAMHLALMFGGLAVVVLGSDVLIGSAKVIASKYGVPDSVIAVTLVAFGTSLPELVTAIASVAKGHAELMVGNIIGADILNVLFVIGASATATPLRVDPIFFVLLLPGMVAMLGLLQVFILLPGERFSRWMGIPLVGAYVVFTYLTIRFGAVTTLGGS